VVETVSSSTEVDENVKSKKKYSNLDEDDDELEVEEDHAEVETVIVDEGRDESILETVMPTSDQAAQLFIAEERLVEQCMNERGLPYIPISADDDLEPPERVERGDIEIAKLRGYGISDDIEFEEGVGSDTLESVNSASNFSHLSAGIVNPNDVYLSSVSEEEQQTWHEALMGKIDVNNPSVGDSVVGIEDPSGGAMYWDSNACLTNARRELYDSDIEHMEDSVAAHSLQERMINYIDENVEFQSVFSQWKDCMAENDLPNEFFGEAADVLSGRYYNGELSVEELRAEEIRVATIDASCYQQHSLGDVLAIAESQAEARLWDESAEEIIELQNSVTTAVEKSRKYSEVSF